MTPGKQVQVKGDYAVLSKAVIRKVRENWFLLSMLVIGFVSLFDTYLIWHFESEMLSMEENPIGYWLLELDNGRIGIFVRTKLAGTICVLSTLLLMWRLRSRIVFPVTTSVASYQVGLFFYLTVS
jgi:hypothetical protein